MGFEIVKSLLQSVELFTSVFKNGCCCFENKIVRKVNEYQSKLELGKQIKQIVRKVNAPKACLDKENMEAMELYENHGLW